MGPLTDDMKKRMKDQQGDIRYDVTWTTLAEYLAFLEKKGVAPNVASYVGAATVREHVVGWRTVRPRRRSWTACATSCGGRWRRAPSASARRSSTPPAIYANTEELIELCKVAAQYKGKYISHLRSEGGRLLEAVDELIRISREAGLPAEIYHLKAAGEKNWPKMDQVIARVEAARREGLAVTADMYTYTAGATGFDACLPPLGAGRRVGRALPAARRSRRPAPASPRRCRSRRWAGRTSARPRARRSGCSSSSSRTRP